MFLICFQKDYQEYLKLLICPTNIEPLEIDENVFFVKTG